MSYTVNVQKTIKAKKSKYEKLIIKIRKQQETDISLKILVNICKNYLKYKKKLFQEDNIHHLLNVLKVTVIEVVTIVHNMSSKSYIVQIL